MRSNDAVRITKQSSQTSQEIRLVLGGGIQAYRIAVHRHGPAGVLAQAANGAHTR